MTAAWMAQSSGRRLIAILRRMGKFGLTIPLVCASLCAQTIPLSEYKERREHLRKSIEGSTLVLFGEADDGLGDTRDGFFQEPNVLYLTGWNEPGAILLMDSKSEILLLPARNQKKEIFMGRLAAPGDEGLAARTGFTTVLAAESFESQLSKMLETSAKVLTLESHPQADKLKTLLAMRKVGDATAIIAKLRAVKSKAEVAMLQRSIDVTLDAHRAAWKRVRGGLYEYQIATTMTAAYSEAGCERNAYPPIVGSGKNSTILHYFKNTRRMDAGEVLLMDVGAECSGYAADVTRTVPINGKFTPRQREIYAIVLGAQNAAIAAVKPGITFSKTDPNSLYKIAMDYINSHGKDLHGEPLGKYFTHGLGHHVGLDVHDPQSSDLPLMEGAVVTIEPGVYIPEEGFGVRIEDMVLVTANGGKLLSGALPREAKEIERSLAGVKK